jgi:endonuclease YncB( thermonuclease family)
LIAGTAIMRLSIAIALLATGCSGDDDAALEQGDQGVVATIADGDSFRLEDGRQVRLLQVDAPERGECHYDASARALESLLPRGRAIELEPDPGLDDHDDFGRLLRYVTSGGVEVNLRLVEQGSAAPYFFRGERGRHAAALLRAAERARAARRGFWGSCRDSRLEPGLGAVTGRP